MENLADLTSLTSLSRSRAFVRAVPIPVRGLETFPVGVIVPEYYQLAEVGS